MSMKWPGGLIRKTPVTPAGPLQNGAAPGMWTMAEAAYWTKQGLWPIAGNFLAVEDVFSTYLFTGVTSGSSPSQTITNEINLSGNGGLVWHKSRSNAQNHFLMDTVSNQYLNSNTTNAGTSLSGSFTALSNGYTTNIGTSLGQNYASWTFREAANFFDVVTYTGNGSSSQTIAHNLGVAPGFIVVKSLNVSGNWVTYHRSTGATDYMLLNATGATAASITAWNNTNPTATNFTVGSSTDMNTNGNTYVAYLFAHDTSSTGLIQCGSFTDTGSGATVSLGWEPQWVLVKKTDSAWDWVVLDTMRGWNMTTNDRALIPNQASDEASYSGSYGNPTATGFTVTGGNFGGNGDYIYIAIRRGPMKTPTLGTTVFAPILQQTGTLTTGFPIDTQFARWTGGPYANNTTVNDRLRAFSSTTTANTTGALITSSTSAETIAINTLNWTNTTAGVPVQLDGTTGIYWNFRRAPSFFDEVCYTGTGGSALTLNHNLGVAPELVIFKQRSGTSSWVTLYSFTSTTEGVAYLNLTNAGNVDTYANHGYLTGAPTASQINLRASSSVGQIGQTYVAYLFASCPGVSKVGTYTGTGALQTINCGFTTGARFVLIKRTDSTGDWYVWDSARGIVAGNDPYLLLNSTAAEVTGTDYVDTDNSGFQLSSTAPAALNANGGTYLFLAIS